MPRILIISTCCKKSKGMWRTWQNNLLLLILQTSWVISSANFITPRLKRHIARCDTQLDPPLRLAANDWENDKIMFSYVRDETMNLSLLYDSNDNYLDPEIILAKKPWKWKISDKKNSGALARTNLTGCSGMKSWNETGCSSTVTECYRAVIIKWLIQVFCGKIEQHLIHRLHHQTVHYLNPKFSLEPYGHHPKHYILECNIEPPVPMQPLNKQHHSQQAHFNEQHHSQLAHFNYQHSH